MNAVLKSLDYLSTQEKLQLVEDLWDDIADRKDVLPITQVARDEVVRRAAWRDAHPGDGKSLYQIISEVGVHW